MAEWWAGGESIPVERVLREWVEREARKEQYPDADPAGWGRGRLVSELTETYEEPAEPVLDDALDWRAVDLIGEQLGDLGTFPEPAWDRLSGDGTVAGAINRGADSKVSEAFPKAVEKIAWFAEHPDREFGAAVAWQRDGEWPPVLLDGNHRACGLHCAARQGASVRLTVHLGLESPPESRTG